MARASARLSPSSSRWASVGSGIAAPDYPCDCELRSHTPAGHGPAAARARRARAAPRRTARPAALDARAPEAVVELRAPARPPGLAEAAVRKAPADGRLRVRLPRRDARDRQ